MSPFKVIIIGSGLAGSLLPNGLARHYRRCSKKEGYQIRLGENVLVGLRACLEKDRLMYIVRKFGCASAPLSDAPIIYDHHFKWVLDLGAFPAYAKSAPINRFILRDALAEPLDRAGRLHYEKAFSRYEIVNDFGSERVRVWFEDGTSDDCDILVGADGNRSRLNKQLGLNNIQTLQSHAIFLTKCELPVSTYKKLSPELLGSPIGTSAQNASLLRDVEFVLNTTDRQDGSAPTVYDHQLSSCMLGCAIPADILPRDLTSLSTEAKWDLTHRAFKEWSPKYQEAIELFRGQDVYAFWPRVGSRPSMNWHESICNSQRPGARSPSRLAFGRRGAPHAVKQCGGMGGNQAMRDAADMLPVLVELAEKYKSSAPPGEPEIKDACRRYEQAMIPRAFEWVSKSGGRKPVLIDTARRLDRLILALVA
ncbi:hypothetical protein DFH08DRAFT_922644 [Mycena albidolilacea]|uniref:FAD-binding domain-containing protein n=1 Tax=Mycena albidolilacea TaxID=1033008 RepID=A0AAD7EY76_9AGAR|nr:hypothetical protein DFH08DRAFT_922644 [Mycena albidolilacea]